MEKISLAEKFSLVHEHWSPKVVADLNGQQVKVVKLKGDFIWHHHAISCSKNALGPNRSSSFVLRFDGPLRTGARQRR